MAKKLCFAVEIAGLPIKLYQQGIDRFTVVYWKQVKKDLRRKVPDHPWQFRVRPTMPHGWWRHAADCIRDTINGVGYFHFNTLKEFLESGPYTPRKAVLNHLQWMKDRAKVYGDTSAKSIYEDAWRR